LLLLSPDYLARDACYLVELQQALRRHQAGLARIVPVLLRPTDLLGSPLCALQRLPTDGRALTEQPDRGRAWVDVVAHLHEVLASLRARAIAPPPPGSDQPAPPDGPYQPALHVHRLRDERRALPRLLRPGAPVALQGPNHAGKRWLLGHLIAVTVR